MGGPPSASSIRPAEEDYQVPVFPDPRLPLPGNQNNQSRVRSIDDKQQPLQNSARTHVPNFVTDDGSQKMGSLSDVAPRDKSYESGDYVNEKPWSLSQVRPNFGSTANEDVLPAPNMKQAGKTLNSAELAEYYAKRTW